MAKLPPISRFLREDFPGQDWIDKLLWPLNQFMNTIYGAMNKNLTLNDNCACQIKTISVTSDGSGNASTSFAWGLSAIPTDVWVSRVTTTSGSNPSGAVGILWEYDGTKISVGTIFGLANSSTYNIRIIAMANG